MTQNEQLLEYGIYTGCTVKLIKDAGYIGIVKHIDENLPDITTCNVCWIEIDGEKFDETDDITEMDIQWSNKLLRI